MKFPAVLLIAAFFVLLLVGPAGARDLMAPYDEGGKRFEEIEISDRLTVYFHQRMLGPAIVEKDYVVYQFERESGRLLARKSHWREDLPEALPDIQLTAEQAGAMVGGDIRSVRLYVISPESDVFPLEPAPDNPCWVVVAADGEGRLTLTVVDAVTGDRLGEGVPPPYYTAFSLTGPCYDQPCRESWSAWAQNARHWFDAMGYSTEMVVWPTEDKVRSHIQSTETAMFYELAHGGSSYFGSGCVDGEYTEWTTADEIEQWMVGYEKMPFTFVGSCGGMCETGDGTFAYEFTQGSSVDAAVVGYCGMSESQCDLCWTYSIDWQDALFSYMSQGWTVKDAYDQANADYPSCASGNCMRFAGDTTFSVVPVVTRGVPDWVDVTSGVLGDSATGRGAAWGDFDADGDPDLYVANKGAANVLLRNDGGAFIDATSGPLGDSADGRGVAWGDYDNDGDLDLYLVNSNAPNCLFRNDGGGFVDLTDALLGDSGDGQAAAWADYDLDGNLDLYLVNANSPNRLFHNEGDGTFADATSGPLGDAGNGRGVAWGDYDNDGDPDLFIANGGSGNKLLRNDGGTFTDVTSGPVGARSISRGAAWGDYDNDGDLDLYVSNMFGANSLLRNDGGGSFADVTSGPLGDAGNGSGVAWADYDNDGDLDLFIANWWGEPSKLLRNDGGGSFGDATTAVLADEDNVTAVLWGDYDLDGDLDLYLAKDGANRLIRNDVSPSGHWLEVELVGMQSNRAAIGTRVRVVAGGLSQIREVSGGSGYLSQDSLPVEFGLGSASMVDSLIVRWPSGLVEVATAVPADQVVEAVEGTWTTGVSESFSEPVTAALEGNFPNPFNPVTLISFSLPERATVSLRVYDASGRLVRSLFESEFKTAGRHTVPWDGRDDRGKRAASGVYFYRLEVGGRSETKRMVLLK